MLCYVLEVVLVLFLLQVLVFNFFGIDLAAYVRRMLDRVFGPVEDDDDED